MANFIPSYAEKKYRITPYWVKNQGIHWQKN